MPRRLSTSPGAVRRRNLPGARPDDSRTLVPYCVADNYTPRPGPVAPHGGHQMMVRETKMRLPPFFQHYQCTGCGGTLTCRAPWHALEKVGYSPEGFTSEEDYLFITEEQAPPEWRTVPEEGRRVYNTDRLRFGGAFPTLQARVNLYGPERGFRMRFRMGPEDTHLYGQWFAADE